MTSKGAVKLAYTEFQKDFVDGEESNEWLKNVIKGLKQAEKDLEVLEIIKKHIIAKTYKYGTDFDSYNKISLIAEIIQLKDFTNELNGIHYTAVRVDNDDNDFEKIKEWLENE